MDKDLEVKNAIIESVSIDIERGGMLIAWLHLDYGGSCQGFGGQVLYLDRTFSHHNEGGPYCGHFIFRAMKIAGVESWNKLPGKTIRVKVKDDWGKIVAIGHIVKDDWFCPEDDFEQIKKAYTR